MRIYLASRSPRRQQLLQQIEIPFEMIDVKVDEHWNVREHPAVYVERLAVEKAQAGLAEIGDDTGAVVIGADTAVVIDDQVLGKAENQEQAGEMLRRLSGRMHHVYSAVAIVTVEQRRARLSRTTVCFKSLTEGEIEDYCHSGEAIGKAGGYAIQGRAAVFVESIQGSYSGVVGLPLYEMYGLLQPFLHQLPAADRRQ